MICCFILFSLCHCFFSCIKQSDCYIDDNWYIMGNSSLWEEYIVASSVSAGFAGGYTTHHRDRMLLWPMKEYPHHLLSKWVGLKCYSDNFLQNMRDQSVTTYYTQSLGILVHYGHVMINSSCSTSCITKMDAYIGSPDLMIQLTPRSQPSGAVRYRSSCVATCEASRNWRVGLHQLPRPQDIPPTKKDYPLSYQGHLVGCDAFGFKNHWQSCNQDWHLSGHLRYTWHSTSDNACSNLLYTDRIRF